MSNRLVNENSPYLIQHAENPVDWFPWGNEALEKARREDKPIFLSIGYAACHWCHVMAHESFEDPQTAALMNEHFINIKVDREERPDLDSIYMKAVVALTGSGGWPMSVFLTPDGTPFFGGTYFPPARRYGMPSFREVLQGIAQSWREERPRVLQAGQDLSGALKSAVPLPAGELVLDSSGLDEAAMGLAKSYDWKYGGWGKAPKFPQPMVIEFLLRRAAKGDRMARDMAIHALQSMAKGGMYDVVGGGFARYSTDNNWLIPHFEKMLYDNAQLARVYLAAYLLTGDSHLKQVCEETLDFMARELMDPEGGFYSSLDADSEGEEGKYYLWSLEEIRTAIKTPSEAEFFEAAYGVHEKGNFEGRTVLQRDMDDAALAERFGVAIETVPMTLQNLHNRLLEVRAVRVHPGTDDKVLVAWNSLALIAFSEAARYLQRPDYLQVARKNADFLLRDLYPQDRLLRSWRRGQARHNAYLEDHAGLIMGLLALYQSDPDERWFKAAVRIVGQMLAHFSDPEGGFFDTRDDHGPLPARPKDLEDNATPCGSSLAAEALLQLWAYTARGDWRELADGLISGVLGVAIRYPTAFGRWLCASHFASNPVKEIAVLGPLQDPRTHALISALWSAYRPNAVLAQSPYPPALDAPPLLQDRPLLNTAPTAYICQNFACLQPVNSPQDFLAQLNR